MAKAAVTPKTLRALLDGLTGCQVLGDVDVPVTSVAYHSREVSPGGLFVALKGARTDGHLYLAASLDAGARVVVTEQELVPPPGVTVVRVPQARLALAHISAAFYGHPSRELTLVGITGTNGKTTTTYILEAILSAAGCRVGVVGTVNYRVGESTWPAPVTTPESLDLQRLLREMRTRGVTHVFLEVSSHALDLRRVDGAVFAAAVFTNLSQDHLDYHRDLDDYFAAKSRLFLEILANGRPSRGLAVLNLDDPRGGELKDAVGDPALTYGLHPDSQVRPLSYRFRQDGLSAHLTTPAGEVKITSRLVGPFNLANILAAAATALGLGIDPDTVARGIAALPGVPGRLERFGPPQGPGVFVDYAHTPAAVTQALEALHTLNFSRLITVFGCGGDRDRGKRPLMGAAAAAGSQLVIVTSDNPRTEDPLAIIREIEPGLSICGLPRLDAAAAQRGEAGYLVVPDRREAIRLAVSLARPGEAVLVAGKGHENYQIWGAQRRHFDDREEVAQALKEYHG
ncbi:MAG: UDP-N-acetylmuramoyl-L-alanyl-D-glutamate--2,6-diaminopimelate ligase [Desulfobacterales bacterium]|nr:UDP-N-acetylmuramoyl-L-alanyl-D-glutamate--2,6-diaminopimelate ligase [Pseudomonadota bacterium]MCG2772621.1 UDP-N-acetylmuramoyl-L-alanyl-D-glutamate--2,6-diaminopimelate ligase [Desulfobacterales bacterium]